MKTEAYTMGKGIKSWEGGKAYSVTFIVTEDCNLRCKYCYQVHKNNKKRMSFEIAQKAVDYLLDHPDLFNSEAVTWEFIGGEPLLEMELINQICDYIKVQMYKKNHHWFNKFRFNIGTNGTLYQSEAVKKFIRRNKETSNIGITIDGTKQKHDLQRIYQDGHGSYDDVVANIAQWLKDYPGATTKVTFGHDDLPLIKDSIIHLWNLGLLDIPANVVFEDAWEDGDAEIFESQLRGLADYIIENKVWNKLNCTLFDELLGGPLDQHDLFSNHCGTGRMLAIDADGNFYPCLRFVDFSLVQKQPRIIGNIYDGIDADKVRPFLALTTQIQSSQKCLECEIAKGCAWCQGNNYDDSYDGTIFHRATCICEMHKARVRANNYYWNRLENEVGITRKSPSRNKKHMYFLCSDDAVEYCGYRSLSGDKINIMGKDILKKGLEYCEQNFYRPVILHSKEKDHDINVSEYKTIVKDEIFSSRNLPTKVDVPHTYVAYTLGEVERVPACENCILNIGQEEIKSLSDAIAILLHKCNRVNINFLDIDKNFPLEEYEDELLKIVDILCSYYKQDTVKEVNVLTDLAYSSKMDNCTSGENAITLAPNGKFYICPAFYFDDTENFIGDLETDIDWNKINQCKLDKAPMCVDCKAYHCNRCVYINQKYTDELSVSPGFQCRKTYIEMKLTKIFVDRCKEFNLSVDFTQIEEDEVSDPIEKVIRRLSVNPYTTKLC